MWASYRKRLPLMQATIVALCLAFYFVLKLPLPTVAAAFVLMQIGSVFGAWWGHRLQRRIEADADRSPLDRR
jgi:uncharacterized membrane protein YfcA